MSLCSACAEHFRFSRPDIVERVKDVKRQSIEHAVRSPHEFSESQIDILRRDLEWYERQVPAATVTGAQDCVLFPLPWAARVLPSLMKKVFLPVEVWKKGHERTYGQIQSSPDCQMCVTILSAIQYLARNNNIEIDSDAQIKSRWMLIRGTCRPSYMEVAVRCKSESIFLLFGSSVDDSGAGTISL